MTRGNRVLASAIVVGVLIEVRWTEVLTGILGFLRGKAFQVAGLGTSVGPIEGHALPTAPQLAMALLMATGLGLVATSYGRYGFSIDELNGLERAELVYEFLSSGVSNRE